MSVEKWGWVSVALTGGASITLGAFLFVYANGLDAGQNQAAAGWVQAIGSIGAIVGAFLVGQMQAKAAGKHALDIATKEADSRREAITAVVGMAYVHASTVAESVGEKTPAEALKFWTLHAKAEIRSAIATMDMLPFHEVGDLRRVQGAMAIRSSLLRIEADMLQFETEYQKLTASQLRGLQGKVAAEVKQADTNWKTFQSQ